MKKTINGGGNKQPRSSSPQSTGSNHSTTSTSSSTTTSSSAASITKRNSSSPQYSSSSNQQPMIRTNSSGGRSTLVGAISSSSAVANSSSTSSSRTASPPTRISASPPRGAASNIQEDQHNHHHSIETITPIKRIQQQLSTISNNGSSLLINALDGSAHNISNNNLSEFEDSPNTKTLYNEQQDLRERVDQYLKEAFENRLASMMNLRVQMEELASAQKQEEDNYVHTIREIVRRSTFENERRREVELNLKGKLNEVEGRLKSEFNEKQKTFEEFQNFKEKGTSIIYRLRDSLKKITEKYKEEKQKNSSLKKQLKDCEDAWEDEVKKRERYEMMAMNNNASNHHQDGGSNDVGMWKDKFLRVKEKNVQLIDKIKSWEERVHQLQQQQGHHTNTATTQPTVNVVDNSYWKKKEKVFETKINEFQLLLEEQESYIENMKRKLSLKQHENTELSKELKCLKVERGVTLEILETTSVEIPKEYMDVYTEIKGLLDPEDTKNLQTDSNPYDKIKSQNRFIRLLLSKLKTEESERVKTHEQSVSLVLEQERTISFLERKIREVESIVIEQHEEARKENLRISHLTQQPSGDDASNECGDDVKIGEGTMDEGSVTKVEFTNTMENDEGKLQELEKKLDIITQDLNNSIRSIKDDDIVDNGEEEMYEEEPMVVEVGEEVNQDNSSETPNPLKDDDGMSSNSYYSSTVNSQDELIADCKEEDEI